MDSYFQDLGVDLESQIQWLGFNMSHRTMGLLHQAGEADDDYLPLTERDAAKWMKQFSQHKLMMLIFFGPVPGTLELSLFDQPEAGAYEVFPSKGAVVILRPDFITHRFFAPGKSFVLSCFFIQPKTSKNEIQKLTPAAQELDNWIEDRLRMIKENETDDTMWNTDIPREWQLQMNHKYHRGQLIAVRGDACKFPTTWDPQMWQASFATGPDYVIEIPLTRYDWKPMYDPDPEGWKFMKSYNKHCGHIDGVALFDCKAFGISQAEAGGMDPNQRIVLENAYEALFSSGLKKNKIMNASIGVYMGHSASEWGSVPKQENAVHGATGGAASITSNRISFCLGMKGPSLSIDTEGSSGLVALYSAAESVQRKGRMVINDRALAMGVHLVLMPDYMPQMIAAGWISYGGRCFTFDNSADGYVRCDASAGCVVTPLHDLVDGTFIVNEQDPIVGVIASAVMNNNGKNASLNTPSGPAEQEAIAEAIRNASISPLDIDGVEAHGMGNFLSDAIEVSSLMRGHRQEETKSDNPCPITALKSKVGNMVECAGLASFMLTMHRAAHGAFCPGINLHQVNPHMDMDAPVQLLTENIEYRMKTSYTGVMSRGFGGTNVYAIEFGQLDESQRWAPLPPPTSQEAIHFWPGGGVDLDESQEPTKGYYITGTWAEWSAPALMELEGTNAYGYTVTLGEEKWEEFQIWLDGDSTRMLHPMTPDAGKGMPVMGPDENAAGFNWTIDGRPSYEGMESITEGTEIATIKDMDAGNPGDQYRVHLQIAGKWRMVTWDKLESKSVEIPKGKYYLAANWNNWKFKEMNKDPANPGVFYIEETMVRDCGEYYEFQIVRNRSWSMKFYPATEDYYDSGVDTAVCGPDEGAYGNNWFMRDVALGDKIRIEFQRETSTDTKVSWRVVGKAEMTPEEIKRQSKDSYAIVGTWDNWYAAYDMRPSGNQTFQFWIILGRGGKESFQIIQNNMWEYTLFPTVPDASPHVKHFLQGPARVPEAHGLNWTIGAHEEEQGEAGDCYEVTLSLNMVGRPEKVLWKKINAVEPAMKKAGYVKKGMW